MRAGGRSGTRRSRSAVALVVLTAWFGSLLVAAPLASAGAAAVAPPTVVAPDPSAGNDSSPPFTLTPNNDGDPLQCAALLGAASTPSDSDWGSCGAGSAATSTATITYRPALTTDGTWVVFSRSVHTSTVDAVPPDTATATITTTDYSAVASATYAFDKTPPVLTLTSGPTGTGGDPAVHWVVDSAESPPVAVTCTLSPASATSTATTQSGPCDGTAVFPSSPLTVDGTYVLTASASDAAGNLTTGQELARYTLDTTGPALTLTAGPTGAGRSDAVTWKVTAAGGRTVSCVLTAASATSTVAQTADCASFPVTLPRDDTYTLTASASDAAGNARTQVVATYELDRVAPTISVSPASTSSTTAQAGWTVTVGAGGLTPTCTMTSTTQGTGETFGTGADCDQYTAFTLPREGTYTLTATTGDAAGNTASATGTWLYRTAPVVSVTTAKPTGNTTTVDWLVTAPATADLTCTLQLMAPTLGADAQVPCTAGTVRTSLTAGDGTYRFTADALDAATLATGRGSADFLLDTQPLPAFTVGGTSGDIKDRAVSWSWTDPSGTVPATRSCLLVTTAPVAATSTVGTCASPVAQSLTSDGTWHLHVTLYDAAGNATSADGPDVRLDTQVPAAPGVNVFADKYLSNNTAPSWTLTGEAGTRFTCRWTTTVTAAVTLPPAGTCTSPYAPTLPSASGSYTLHVTQTDAAGNTSPETPSTPYVLDLDKPVVAFTAQPTGPVNALDSTRDVWKTSGEADATSSCSLTWSNPAATATAVIYAGQSCGRAIVVPANSVEGSYVLTVIDTDAAGNTSPAISSTPFVIDRTDPGAPSITSSPVTPSQALSATWTVLANDPSGTDLQCRFMTYAAPGYTTAQDWTICGPTVVWSPLPGEGRYRLDVRARDAAGNVSGVVSSADYVVDQTPPPAAFFTSAAGTGFTRSATWSWTGEAGATAQCRLLRESVAATGPAGIFHDCSSPRTESLDGLDGRYELQVTLTDAARNTNAAVTGPAYVLDTAAPDAPVVSGPTGPSKTQDVTWTYTTTELVPPALLCQLTRADAATSTATIVQAFAPCTSLQRTLPALTADGYYRMELRLKDAAGNVSPVGTSPAYLLDTTPPAPATFFSAPSGTANRKDVSWGFTRDADATAECQLLHRATGASAFTAVISWVSCGTPYGAALTYGDGDYALQVRLTDPVRNTNAPVTSGTYTLDATAPGPPTVTGPSGTKNVTTATYEVTSTIEARATAECRLTFETTPGAWTSCTLPKTYTLGGDGNYFLEVRLTDLYGNVGDPGRSPTYLLDTRPPVTPVVTAPASPSKNGNPVFTFTSDPDATNTCTLARGGVVVAAADGCRGSFTGAITGLADGDYVLTVLSTDAAGNTASASSGAYTYDTTPPPAPVVSGPRGPSQNRTPTFTWTAETGARAECALQAEGSASGPFVACSSPYLPLLPSDGTWSLTVRVTDVAGNTSAPTTGAGYVLDTTPPVAPVVVAPSSPGRDTNPSWSASVEPGAITECRITAAGAVAGPFALCTLPLSTALGADGSYLFEVRATDAAGNVSEIGTGSYVLDTAPPPAPVVTQPTAPTRNRASSVAFAIEPGATATCRVSRGTAVISPTAPCTSPAAVDLTGQPDGGYTLTVRAVDAAGNIGPAGTAVVVLDTTAPAAPTLTLIPGSPSSDRAPTFAFNHEAGATAVCRLTAPGAAPRELSCAETLTLDLAGAADGSYAVAVLARDLAGNTSTAATTTYVLDSTAGIAPRVVGPVSPGSNRAPVWKITSTGPAECRLLRNGTTLKDWAPCGTSYLADLFGQPDAVYALEARLIGTTAATFSRYRLDTAAPPIAVLTAPPSPGTTRRPVWTVATTEPVATAECRALVFGAVLKDWAACPISVEGSLYALDLTGFGDGTYTLAVRVTDAASNTGQVVTSDYVLDTSAPSAVGVVAPPSPGRDTTPTWTISSVPGVLLECRVTSGQKLITDFVPCSGEFTADLGGLPDGVYTLTVRALSAAGTPGPETARSYELKTNAEAAPGALTGPTGPSRDRAPVWTFVVSAGSTATCKVTSGGRVLRDGPCSSPFTMDLSSAPDGTYVLEVRTVDAAGNTSGASVAGYVLRTLPAPAPTFSLVPGSPSSTTDPHWGFSTAPTVTAQCRRSLNGSVTEDWTSCTSPLVMNLFGQPDGRYTLAVRAIDAAGNTSSPISADYVLDRTAEPLAVFADTPRTPGNDPTPTWVVGPPGAPGAALRRAALTGALGTECRLTTPRGTGTWAPCAGSYTAATTGDGSYVLEVRATDPSGATGPASASTYVLDTRAPEPQRFTEEPPAVGREAVATWSWTEDPLLLTECRLARPGQVAGAFTRCTAPQIVTANRGEGTYGLEVRNVDAAGNPSPSTVGSYRFDRTPPTAPVFATRPAPAGVDDNPTWTFAVPLDSTATCVSARNGTVVSEGACNGSFALDLLGQQPADWTVSVRFVDTAGNEGPATTGRYALLAALNRSGGFGPVPTGSGSGPLLPRGDAGLPGLTPVGDRPGLGSPLAGLRLPEADRQSAVAERVAAIVKAVEEAVAGVPDVRIPGFPGLPEGLGVPDALKNAVTSTITKPQLPLALFFIVLLFLLVQNQIDRRDPKLAAAPVLAEPDLVFGPRVAGPGFGGGGRA